MSYQGELNALARDLSRLLIAEEPVPTLDLATAAGAHAAAVGLLTQVHRDLTGISPWAWTNTPAEIGGHPVAALGRLLADHPRRPSAAPTDLVGTPAATAAGQLWRDVARHATLAHHEWVTSAPRSSPKAEKAWSALADVAALAEAAATLDPELARAMTAAGRHDDADVFTAASVSGLRVAAAEVRSLAAAGPLPDVDDLTPASTRPVAVRAAEAVPEAQHRLALLLTQAEDLRPADIEQIITTQGRTALAAARLAREPCLASELREYARRCADVAGHPHRTASIRRSDPRPLAQARELHRYLATPASPTAGIPADAAVAAAAGFGRGVPEVNAALSATATRQVEQGRWLVPEPEVLPDRPIWTRSGSRGAPEPPMLASLRAVAASAVRVSEAAAGVGPQGTSPARLATHGLPPRDALRDALAFRGRPDPPAHPGQRPSTTGTPRPPTR